MHAPTGDEDTIAEAEGHRRRKLLIGATILMLLFAGLASPRLVGAQAGSSVHRPNGAQVSGITGLAQDDDDEDDEDDDEADDDEPDVTTPTAGATSGDEAVAGSPSFTG